MKDTKMFVTPPPGGKGIGIPDSDAVKTFQDKASEFKSNKTKTSSSPKWKQNRYTKSNVATKDKLERGNRSTGHTRSLFYDDSSSSPVNFSPNLQLKMYTDPKTSNVKNGYHKLHILAITDYLNFFSLLDATQESKTVWFETRNQYFKLVNDVQRETNNNSYTKITTDKFSKYFNKLTQLLDAYYCVDSILSYKPTLEESNTTLESMRLQLISRNPGIFETQNRLRRVLMNTAIPPNMLEYVRWKNQAFKFSELGQSSAFKFTSSGLYPDDFNSVSGQYTFMTDKTNWANYVDFLINTFMPTNDIIAPVLKARPHWLVTDLPLMPNTTVYDIKAIDIFSNHPMLRDKSPQYPSPASPITGFTHDYNTIADPSNQDGMIEAFCAFSDDISGFWEVVPTIQEVGSLDRLKLKSNRWIMEAPTNREWDPKISHTTLVDDLTEAGLTYNIGNFAGGSTGVSYKCRHDGKSTIILNSTEGITLNSRLYTEWLFN